MPRQRLKVEAGYFDHLFVVFRSFSQGTQAGPRRPVFTSAHKI
jgi:hypothetical protein